jgi:Flagellin and related hook-associated proteins
VRSAKDDPVGAARLLQLEQQQNMLKQYSGNITNVRNALGTAESTLNSIGTILQRVNELAVSSGNGSFTDSDRKANADELASLEDQLFTLMNSKDENGKYIFSGSKGEYAALCAQRRWHLQLSGRPGQVEFAGWRHAQPGCQRERLRRLRASAEHQP